MIYKEEEGGIASTRDDSFMSQIRRTIKQLVPERTRIGLRLLQSWISENLYLYKTSCPFKLFLFFNLQFLEGKALDTKYRDQSLEFEKVRCRLDLSSDWFSHNIPFWLSIIDELDLKSRPVEVLEIGSFEGLSGHFILSTMPNARLTCVDSWGGDEEDEGNVPNSSIASNEFERRFDRNLTFFKDRVTKYKTSSYSFFHDHPSKEFYDFIYVDGSHSASDVIIDAIKCFEMLKIGGVIIFDDYFWNRNPTKDNPAAAINFFLRLNRGTYRVVKFYYQLVLVKISSDS